jgi:branched-chain amino acid transport system substrate-binding protein
MCDGHTHQEGKSMYKQHRFSTRRATAILGATALLMGLAACSGATSPTATATAGGSVDLRVGVLQANNAVFTLPSKSTSAAGVVAAKIIKQKGVTIEQFPIENDGTPNGALQAIQRAVQDDKITVVTGFISSDVAAALAAQAQQLGVVIVDAVSQDPSLAGANCAPAYFRTPQNSTQVDLSDFSLPDAKSAKSWDVFAPDSNYGHGAAAAFVATAKSAGVTIKQQVFETPGTTDFSPYISKLAGAPADALLVVSQGTDAATFATQAQSFKLFPKYKVVVGQGLVLPETLLSTGTSLQNVQEVFAWVPDSKANGSAAFVKAYEAATKATPPYAAANTFIAFQMAAQAAASAKSSNPDALRKALSGKTFDTIGGSIKIRAADHVALRPLAVVKVVLSGGKAVIQTQAQQISATETTPPVNSACKL